MTGKPILTRQDNFSPIKSAEIYFNGTGAIYNAEYFRLAGETQKRPSLFPTTHAKRAPDFYMNDLSKNSQLLIYQSPSGDIKIDVRLDNETVWLTQKLMAELFKTSVPNINMHLKSIYEEEELEEGATIKEFLIVQKEDPHAGYDHPRPYR
jgi:hypothetical protein